MTCRWPVGGLSVACRWPVGDLSLQTGTEFATEATSKGSLVASVAGWLASLVPYSGHRIPDGTYQQVLAGRFRGGLAGQYRPLVGGLSVACRWPVGGLSVACRWPVGGLSVACR